MKTADTKLLLHEYTRTGSESAFQELVTRYIGLVYATAVRLVGGDADLAKDVSQIVFVHLARKARGLSGETALGGWLHRDACNVAATMMRSERRRRARERQAMEINALQDHTEANLARLLPILDEAINRLAQKDRAAIMLRFFERYDFHAVGQSLGTSDDGARMRVNRALGKLQALLKQRGVTISATALVTVLASETIVAAPAGLGATVSAASLASSAANTGMLTSLLLAMARMKTWTALAAILIVCISVGAGFILVHPAAHSSAPAADRLTSVSLSSNATSTTLNLIGASSPQYAASSRQLRDAIADLWRAIHEEPVDEKGYATTEKVWAAIRALGSERARAVPTLIEGIQDPNEQVAMCASWGIGMLGRDVERAIPALLKLAQAKSQPHNARMWALISLGNAFEIARHQTPPDTDIVLAALPDMVSLLQDEDVGLRPHVAKTLGQMGDIAGEVVPTLVGMLEYSASPEDAATAAAAGGRSVPDDARLKGEMEQLTRGTKVMAIEALERIGDDAQTGVPQIAALLKDSDKEVRIRAAIALWRMVKSTEGATILTETIYPPMPSPEWQQHVEILGEMGTGASDSVPALRRLCKFVNPEIREPALAALTKIEATAASGPRLNGKSQNSKE